MGVYEVTFRVTGYYKMQVAAANRGLAEAEANDEWDANPPAPWEIDTEEHEVEEIEKINDKEDI